MHEIKPTSPQISPSHKLTMQSHRLALNVINKITSTKLQWVEVQYILVNEEKEPTFIAKKVPKPKGGATPNEEVALLVERKVGGGLDAWEGRLPPLFRYPTWFGKPPPPVTTPTKWQNKPSMRECAPLWWR